MSEKKACEYLELSCQYRDLNHFISLQKWYVCHFQQKRRLLTTNAPSVMQRGPARLVFVRTTTPSHMQVQIPFYLHFQTAHSTKVRRNDRVIRLDCLTSYLVRDPVLSSTEAPRSKYEKLENRISAYMLRLCRIEINYMQWQMSWRHYCARRTLLRRRPVDTVLIMGPMNFRCQVGVNVATTFTVSFKFFSRFRFPCFVQWICLQ